MVSDKNGGLIAEAIFPRPKMGHLGLNLGPKLSLSTERQTWTLGSWYDLSETRRLRKTVRRVRFLAS